MNLDTVDILSVLQQITPLNSSDLKLIEQNSQIQNLKKGDFFLKEGQVAKSVGLIISGLFRVYQIVDGKELTSYFCYKERNFMVSSFPSFLTQNKSLECVETLEDSTLLIINHQQLQSLYENSKNMERLGRILAERNYLLSIERINSLQYKSAADRYQLFMNIYPGLLNRIPHHYIASYLGIAPESMSRIRREMLKK